MVSVMQLGKMRASVAGRVPRARVAVEQALRDREALSKIRMGLSLISEAHNIARNSLDHAVRVAENFYFGQDYLDARLAAYRGQKKAVFLYHGYLQGRPSFERFERLLDSPLFDLFPVAGGYQPYSQDIRVSAEYELRVIERVLSQTGVEEVYIVGHSQGGLVARVMMQELQVPRLKRCVFLTVPHRGTWSGLFGYPHRIGTLALSALPRFPRVVGESGLQMLPGSRFLHHLNALPLPEGVEITSLYNWLDPFVMPSRYGRMPYPQVNNILMMKIGHYHPLYDSQEFEITLRALVAGQGAFGDFRHSVLGGQDVIDDAPPTRDGGRVFVTASD